MVSRLFGSVRQSKSPVATKHQTRDDTHLVSLRYEKTTQAEPPIPMTPRSPSTRSPSIRSGLRRSPSCATSICSANSYSPVVVTPPNGSLPLVAPPVEQHPALRRSVSHSKLALQKRKRDSGHAPTPASLASPVILEESFEDEELPPYSDKDSDIAMTDTKPKQTEHRVYNASDLQHIEQDFLTNQTPPRPSTVGGEWPAISSRPTSPPPPSRPFVFSSPTSEPVSPPPSPAKSPSPKKLVKRRPTFKSFWGSSRKLESTSTDSLPRPPTKRLDRGPPLLQPLELPSLSIILPPYVK